MLKKVKEKFEELFGSLEGTRSFFSPGRVNIIGEHIDYNGGYVMPCAISKGTYFVIRKNNTDKVNVYSLQFEDIGIVSFDKKDASKDGKWTDFVKGVIKIFGFDFGFDMVCGGNLPHSSGLSSSASFETGLGYGLSILNGKAIEGTELALLCKRIENEFMGLNSGIMDQFIICNGVKDGALLLNCNTLHYETIPFDLQGNVLVIANTNKRRQLTDSKYNERKAECDKALEILQSKGCKIDCLCAIDGREASYYLNKLDDETLKKRARHVISENYRTIKASEALKNHDIELLGRILTEAGKSIEIDYEATGKELDCLVHNFLKEEGCLGARMTGAGFGGCAIAIYKKGYESKAIEHVKEVYTKEIGYEPSFYEVEISDHCKEI